MPNHNLDVAHYKWCATSAPEDLETVHTDVRIDDAEVDRIRDELVSEAGFAPDSREVLYLSHMIADRILKSNTEAVEGAVEAYLGGKPGHIESWVIPESTDLGRSIIRSIDTWKTS